ncbi:MAG: hypothetical protein ACI9MR_001935 [Myxococcota bacterium]|jgi:hypothetical protein
MDWVDSFGHIEELPVLVPRTGVRATLLACLCASSIMLGACGTDETGQVVDTIVRTGPACETAAECAGAFEVDQCEAAVCLDGFCEVGTLPSLTPCRDGFACTGPDYCIDGVCIGSDVFCEDNDPCTENLCDAKRGCYFLPDSGEQCNDNNPCTANDSCLEGECSAVESVPGCCRFDGECDDNDPCTDDRCQNNQCTSAFNYAPCNDSNICTSQDHCRGDGVCAGDLQPCDDGNPCTADVCNPDTGSCESGPAADGIGCEDGNPCTTDDTCENGLCVGQGSSCQCTTHADCTPFEDGDLCNGILQCLGNACVVAPQTVVACNPTGDTPCAKNTCDADTGQCAPQALVDGAGCDDGSPCTGSDACDSGLCRGEAIVCNDDNPCTFDSCSPVTGCTFAPNNQPCEDGDGCTTNDHCSSGVCEGDPTNCDDGNGCTTDSCTGDECVFAPNAQPCSDGNACTNEDVCAEGVCTPGLNECQCQVDADCVSEEDGDQCNGTLKCQGNACVVDPVTIVTCDATNNTVCAVAICDPANGQCAQTPRPAGTQCDDGNACTSGDGCTAGVCQGSTVDCSDGNACTTDTCDGALGCANTPNTLTCDDGDGCTGGDRCGSGACNGVTIVCDDGNPCSVDSCDPNTGACTVVNAQNALACDDGSACTVLDRCQMGVCTGDAAQCDDANPCTNDNCDPLQGCRNAAVANNTPCSDNNACTAGDQCTAGTCGGTALNCDDSDPCTTDACDPDQGCQYGVAAETTACDDGDPCTNPDMCDGDGACAAGASTCGCQGNADCVSEEDGDLCNGTLYCDLSDNKCKVDAASVTDCTSDDSCLVPSCEPSTGVCSTVAISDGQPCDDGDGCTENDSCQGGTCGGVSSTCDDTNPCTLDSCASGSCVYEPAFDGQACADDGNSCTGDRCVGGVCAHPPVADGVACAADTNTCTDDQCVDGACAHPPKGATFPCSDDGNICTFDSCDGAGSCQHVSNDPPNVGDEECQVVRELVADSGQVTGTWTDCGVADHLDYSCSGQNCTHTGAINTWNCADPSFLYEGPNNGYEYSYVFVAPSDGVCTFIEYDEGVKIQGKKTPLIDWFILDGSGACNAAACLEYVWENVTGGVCGNNNKPCSYREFAVTEGQVFYVVADIFSGLASEGASTFPFDSGWTVEVQCSDQSVLLINEDFSDAQCNGCSATTGGAASCNNFAWHPMGGFTPAGGADTISTAMYLGEMQNDSLAGYDCGASTGSLTFPMVTLPATATSCTLTLDLYTAVADTDCVNDVVTIMVDAGGGPSPASGSACGSGAADENPVGSSSHPNTRTMSYSVDAFIGSAVTVSIDWAADAANNLPFGNTSFGGVIINDVKLSCEVP